MEEIRGSVNVVESAVARLFYSEDGEDGDTLLGGCSKTAHLSIIMLMRLSIIDYPHFSSSCVRRQSVRTSGSSSSSR